MQLLNTAYISFGEMYSRGTVWLSSEKRNGTDELGTGDSSVL